MAILQNFPSSRPSLNLNFARSKTLDPRVTFTRTSAGTYVDESGIIRTASADEPRFDHNPTTGESLGLLIEEARTNLLTYSEQFNDNSWSGTIKSTGSVSANLIISPDGTLTADKIIPGTNLTRHYVSKSLTITANTTYTASCFAKAGEYNFASVIFGNGSTPFTRGGSIVNLTTGEITIYSVNNPTNVIRHQPINYGNGWWKISVSVLFDSTSTDGYVEIGCSSLATNYSSNSGDGTSGIYVWGAQVEAGAFPTSYIPTTSSTVTRSADNARMTGTNFSSWYNQSEGSLYNELFFKGGVSGSEFPTIVNDAGNAFIGGFYYFDNGDVTSFEYFNTMTNYVSIGTTSSIGPNTNVKNILAYKNGDFGAAANGSIVGTSSSSITFATNLNTLLLGRWTDDNWYINGCIKSCTYYPTRLPNAQLQTLTK
jgi:hypothetical protein